MQRSGLLQLVGGEVNAGPDRIRDVVVDAALGAMTTGFSLEGVVLVAQAPVPPNVDDAEAPAYDPTFLAAKLPPSWSADSQSLFELYGNLWWLLQDPSRMMVASRAVAGFETLEDCRLPSAVAETEQWQIPLGQSWLWLCRMRDGDDVVAAVAMRRAPFEPVEANTLSSLVHAVVVACSNSESRQLIRERIAEGTRTVLKQEGDEIRAEVVAEWQRTELNGRGRTNRSKSTGDSRRIGAARAFDAPTAVAKAAAKACRPRCQVTFAGTSQIDAGRQVSIVMIDGSEHGLRMGYAVREKGDSAGPAEAVFTAALS